LKGDKKEVKKIISSLATERFIKRLPAIAVITFVIMVVIIVIN
jgi:hypothetical protein